MSDQEECESLIGSHGGTEDGEEEEEEGQENGGGAEDLRMPRRRRRRYQSANDLTKTTVLELKAALSARGLPVSDSKAPPSPLTWIHIRDR